MMDRIERIREMSEFEKNKSILSIKDIMERIKNETDYDKEGLVTMLPFLRANNDGTHRLIIPLLKKVALREGEKPTHIIIRKILYADVITGEVIAQEDAVRFFQQYALGDELVKPVPMFRTGIDKSLAEEYCRRQYDLIEKIRREVCENGECMQDTYMDYLKYALYYTSNEFAATLLYLSRTFSTNTSMELECKECHKKIVKDVQGYREGQLVILDCPYCQKTIHAVYHKSGGCITYNDRYMRQERNRFLEMPAPAAQEESLPEGIFDTNTSFSIYGTLPSDNSCQQDQNEGGATAETGQVISLGSTDKEEQEGCGPADGRYFAGKEDKQLVDAQETLSDVPHFQNTIDKEQWSDIACQDEKVIGLDSIKKFFRIIRSMSFLADVTPAPIFALFGDQGCGINTSIRYLSGYPDKEILYTDMSLITEDCLHTIYGCIVIRLYAESNVPAWLPTALSRLKKHTMVFFVGSRDAKLPEELAAHVVYRISYKPYTIEELSELFTSRMTSYGLCVSLTKEQQTQLFRNKNALDVKHLCLQMYFKHKQALYDGKVLDGVISEEEIAREIRGAISKEQRLGNG